MIPSGDVELHPPTYFPSTMPAPDPKDPHDREFWAHIAQSQLVVQRCTRCSHMQHPPLAICESCQGGELHWKTLDGTGTIFTFTVVHHPPSPELTAYVPYVIALIELDGTDRCRMVGNVSPRDARPRIGDRVAVRWEHAVTGPVLPRFELTPTHTSGSGGA